MFGPFFYGMHGRRMVGGLLRDLENLYVSTSYMRCSDMVYQALYNLLSWKYISLEKSFWLSWLNCIKILIEN